MSFTNQPLAGRSVILLAESGFLVSYVADGILAAGGEVLASATSVTEANAVVQGLLSPPDAIVVDTAIFEASGFEHRDTLRTLAIPMLMLINRSSALTTPDHDQLSAPFAAYQVVDYICSKLGLELTRGQDRVRFSR